VLIRTQFPDLFLAEMLPALDDIIFNKFDRLPPQYTKIFRVMKSNRSIEQTSEVVGLGLLNEVAEGASVRYDEAVPGFNKTYTHAQFGGGFKMSRIMVDDDKFALIDKLASDLGRAAKETRELAAAATFINGFSTSYNGPDGKPLFATDHPIVKTNGTQTNTLAVAADLDQSSIELALTDFRTMKDPSGKKVRVEAKRLVVPPQLEFAAIEIMGGNMRSDTANNTVNALKRRSGVGAFDEMFVWDYLDEGDPDAWFIVASPEDTELRWYDREKFNTVHDVDFDSRSIKTAGWMRFSLGWSSFYGVYGCPGA
jgi:phage major head subunit gpT-like protein